MRTARRAWPYLGALAIVLLLLGQIDPVEVLRLLAGVDLGWLLVGLVIYALTNVVRAYRFGVLLTLDAPSPLRILPEMFALSLFNNTLPSRSGELSFPYFMRRRHGMAVGESTAALLVARIFDYLAVALLYITFALSNLSRLAPRAATIVLLVAGLLLLSLLLLAGAPWLGRQGLRLAGWLLGRLRWQEANAGRLLLRGGRRAVTTLERTRSLRIYGLTFGWSLLTWLGVFGWFAAFMRAIGLPISLPLVIVGATFAMLAKALPFITVGGFGAHEAGWAVGFGLVGLAPELAIASGFAVNILTLLASLVGGGLALAYMRIEERGAGWRGKLASGVAREEPATSAPPQAEVG